MKKTCDTLELESSHPLIPSAARIDTFGHQPIFGKPHVFYTHECKNDEIAYFKVDVNLIGSLPDAYLGNVSKIL